MFQKNLKSVSRIFRGCFIEVSRLFQGRLRGGGEFSVVIKEVQREYDKIEFN